ncbi:MAG TPA: wax ester/triacylglycerol synthase family O-acyltransferase [Burkholderiaceae bacterium]|nr:wax ester/triacylglycerol synthase family O-acyltransferase [Burkholderiaceae bacterium]
MKQLSALDATFLYLETPEMPMHVGALHLFELPPGYKGSFTRNLRTHVAARLPLAPALRRKLWWMPLRLANPAWIDATPNLSEHIVPVRLREGSSLAELEAKVGELHAVLLDRSKPLWKFHVFEGLAPAADGRKRVALYTQVHHAGVDGKAAVALANVIFDLTPNAPATRGKKGKRAKGARKHRLSFGEMMSATLANQVQQIGQLVRSLPGTVGTLSKAAGQAARSAASAGLEGKGIGNWGLAPRTALNTTVSTERAFATASVPLAELKAIGQLFGATLNDMVLMLCSTALRRHFAKHGGLPRKSLIAAVPISLRADGDATADNQASIAPVSLGTHIADPVKRLAHIKAATASMKASFGAVRDVLPTDFPSLGLPWIMEAATRLYGRAKLADRIPQLANVAISNVPGPNVPLYLAGARMTAVYPTSAVVHGIALNITVQSYDQSLDFGLMADAKVMPDVRKLAEAIGVAFDDLSALALECVEAGPDVVAAARKALTRALNATMNTAMSTANTAVSTAARSAGKFIASQLRTGR